MQTVLKFINNFSECIKTIWWWLIVAATGMSVFLLIYYLNNGATIFDPFLSSAAIFGFVAAIVLGAISIIKTYREAVFLMFIMLLFALLNFIGTQVNLFGAIAYAVDPVEPSDLAPLIIVSIFTVLSMAASLTAAILKKGTKANAKNDELQDAASTV